MHSKTISAHDIIYLFLRLHDNFKVYERESLNILCTKVEFDIGKQIVRNSGEEGFQSCVLLFLGNRNYAQEKWTWCVSRCHHKHCAVVIQTYVY